jgi:hypothetical protein
MCSNTEDSGSEANIKAAKELEGQQGLTRLSVIQIYH